MSGEPSEDAAWARKHRACFEIAPQVEMRDGEKLQVGFTLDLYAGVPMDKPAGAERREAAIPIWERLRTIVESLVPPEGSGVKIQIEPMRTAAFLRPQNAMEPEMRLRAHVVHAHDYFTAVTADERVRLAAVEKKLTELGLRAGNW